MLLRSFGCALKFQAPLHVPLRDHVLREARRLAVSDRARQAGNLRDQLVRQEVLRAGAHLLFEKSKHWELRQHTRAAVDNLKNKQL